MNIKVRKAKIGDLNDIIGLNRMLFDYEDENKFDTTLNRDWTYSNENEKYFKDCITKKDYLAIIALIDNKKVGYLVGSIKKAGEWRRIKLIAETDNMFVLKDYREKGIGELLIREFISWAKSKNVKRMKVVSSFANKKAISFYRKQGFNEHELVLEGDLD